MTTAITTTSFIDLLGVNTHIDFNAYGYQNLSTVAAAINYLGLKNIRDSAQNASDASAWQISWQLCPSPPDEENTLRSCSGAAFAGHRGEVRRLYR